MARRPSKKVGKDKWQPSGDDAIKLAALRWFALMIEAEAIQLYATNRVTYSSMEAVLRGTIAALHDVKDKAIPPTVDPGECPPGFFLCGNECAPACFED